LEDKVLIVKSNQIAISNIPAMCEAGNYDFKHPLQRSAGQWSKEQKSDLIDSLFRNYPIDAVTLASKDGSETNFYSIDGTQRLTTIRDFCTGKLKLSKHLEPVNGIEVANKNYEELDESLKTLLSTKSIESTELYDWTEKDLKEVFRRKNNGKPLTTAQKQSVVFTPELYSKILDITNLDEVNEKGRPVKNFWNRVIKKGLRKNSEDRSLVLQCMMLLDKNLVLKEGKEILGIKTGFKADNLEAYIKTFQSYKEKDQERLYTYVINASSELDKQFSILEQQIKDSRKAIKNIEKNNTGESIREYEAIIKTNKNRLKAIKKLSIPMLVAGMSKVQTSKGVGVKYYMENVYELLDFLAKLQNMSANQRQMELVVAEANQETYIGYDYYTKYYNTSGTADRDKVNGRWLTFLSFTKKSETDAAESLANEASADEVPAEETLSEEMSTGEVPAEETSPEEMSTGEVSEEMPAEETPA